MPTLYRRTTAEQIADYLRRELVRGRWSGTMPGVIRLARELGFARNSVEAALRELEHDGILENQGTGRRRRIVPPKSSKARRGLRLGMLSTDRTVWGVSYMVDLRHQLEEAGHVVIYADKTLRDLRMDVERVASFVNSLEVDAWVVVAASADVLKWFAEQPLPCFALFGGHSGLPIAASAPNLAPAFRATVRELADLGHRRISLIVRRQHRPPSPAAAVSAFLDELAAQGIPSAGFNLPDWEESKEGFHALLGSLFQFTPPTALVVDEPYLFHATYHYLANRGLHVPERVSLVCTEDVPDGEWCEPSIAHMSFGRRSTVRRVVRWVATVSHGGHDLKQHRSRATFVTGGTIGPVPES